MKPIFLIVGTPASGKSTVSKALVQRLERGLHIPVDDLRHMVVAGLKEPGFDMTEDTFTQIRLARETASHMALKYAQAGFVVAVDDFWMPQGPDRGYDSLLGPGTHKILLLPSLEATLERLYSRNPSEGSFKKYLEQGVRYLFEDIQQHPKTGWRVVDSSNLGVEETVERILELTQLPQGEA
jgi:thymidylate kinase